MDRAKMRRVGHSRLTEWGREREAHLSGAGWPGVSSLVNLQRRLDGDSRSTAPCQISPLEALASNMTGRTLSIERLVADMDDLARGAVLCRYVADRTLSVWAESVGVPAEDAREALKNGILRVGRAILELETAARRDIKIVINQRTMR